MTTIVAVLEQRDGTLRKVSHEVVTAARTLADQAGADVEAVILASGEVAGAGDVAAYGADRIVVQTNAHFELNNPDAGAAAIAARAGESRAIVFAATATGKDLAPRVAAKLGVGLATEVTSLEIEGDAVVAMRPVYAGKALAKVKLSASPALVSVRPNIFTPVENARDAAMTSEAFDATETPRTIVKDIKHPAQELLDVAEASIVVSGGRGLQAPEHFKVVEELAEAIGSGAAVGASRAVVDAGWRSHADQVGQTGKTVSPQLYIAVGISGAVQHLAGMRTAGTIVAINKDKDAPIFSVADYGIVGDLFEIVPRLAEEIRKARA